MAKRDSSPKPMLRPEGFGVSEQTERMLQPEGDPVAPTEVLKTGITKEVMDKAQEYVSSPPPIKQQSPVQKAIDKSLIGGAEEDYEVKVSKVTPEGRGAIRGMISRVLGKEFDGDLDAFYYCTTFVSDMLDSIGADPLNPGAKPESEARYGRVRADAYMKYGTPVDIEDIQEGDIVIFDFPKLPDGTLTLDPTRGKRNGRGDHATFYAGDRLDVNKPGSNYIGVLGGEQGGGAAISMKSFDKSHILGVRRIQYNDIDYEFTKELAKVNPDFNKFLNNEAQAFDFNAFMEQSSDPIQGTNRLTSGFDEGGLTEAKGLSLGELIVDNILGLDNKYESFGEKLGKAINEDEIKFLKDAAVGVYEGTKEFVQAPVETTKQVVNEIKDSVTRLGSEDLNTRLQRMYNVSYEQATDEQVNQAREAVLGDALTALELVPAAKVTTTVAGAAIPSGLKADVVGQTKAMLSGDREFLSATPTNRASTQSLSAGFTGQNPPTYNKRSTPLSQQQDVELDEFRQPQPTEKTELSRKDFVIFRDPIKELAETVTIPKKGLLGSEFLKMVKKNESIADSSLQPQIIDPKRRYTREELLEAIGDDEGYPGPNVFRSETYIGERQGSFRDYQRQGRDAGFLGIGKELDYFELPIMSRPPSGSEGTGKPFKANLQHFDEDTIAHARGSIVQPADGVTVSFEYEDLIGNKPFLLVEEIQSDLLQKGYVKPGKLNDMAFKKVTEEWSRNNYVSFQEAFGEISKDVKNIFEELDEANMVRPDLVDGFGARDKFQRNAIDRGYVLSNELEEVLDKLNLTEEFIEPSIMDLTDLARGRMNQYLPIVDVDTGANFSIADFTEKFKKEKYVSPREKTQKFFDKSRELLAKKQIDKEINFDEFQYLYERYKTNQHRLKQGGYHQDVGLPPITKNRQAVEESLKALIAKAAREGVDKIVIPPADRIAKARDRTLDFSDKGDRFYRTYVTDLNKVLNDLEKNYPVEVRKNVEMPYDNRLSGPRKLEAIEQGLQTLSLRGELETFTVSSPSVEVSIPEDMNYEILRQAMDREVHAENLTSEQEKVFRAFAYHNQVSFDEAPDVFSQWHVKQTDELLKKPWFQSMLPESDTNYGTILDISELIDEYKVEAPRQFAKGGAVNKMSMKQQMSLFEYGGIADDGMTKDPVSGNNIPPGSLAKEVRDDIPAMLSEGEYVIPADVLRFYGVNFFENLRGQAKQGLQSMEQNGRIGGTPMTQQDVARNMQQPTMAPAPVQAAQGAMMQSPMRIQQQTAPQAMGNAMPQQQPIMANQGTMVQGFNDGPMPTAAQYRSSWSPARARYSSPMFQGTSSQQANIAAAQEAAQEQAATEEITQSRKHYNQQGKSAQVEYVGTDPSNMSIKQTEANLAIVAAYPLTEEEWLAYKKEMSKGSGGDGGGEDPTPTGSDTSWMDGIDWSDQQSVKDWVESDNGLGMSGFASGLAEKGGILGAIPQAVQAQDIAKTRGIRSYYESIGDKEMVDYLDGKLKEAMEKTGLLTSALDKLGLLTGKNYLNQMKNLDLTTQQNIELGGMSLEENQAMTAKAIQQKDDDQKIAAEILAEAQKSAESGSTAEIVEKSGEEGSPNREQTEQNLSDVLSGLETGAKTGTIQLNKGGLMTAPKPKKKTRKYNKGGLAGKKK